MPVIGSTWLASRKLSILCFIYRPGYNSLRRVLGSLWSRRAQRGLVRAVEDAITHVVTVGSGWGLWLPEEAARTGKVFWDQERWEKAEQTSFPETLLLRKKKTSNHPGGPLNLQVPEATLYFKDRKAKQSPQCTSRWRFVKRSDLRAGKWVWSLPLLICCAMLGVLRNLSELPPSHSGA